MRLRNIATVYLINGGKVLLMLRVGSRLFNGPIWVGIGGHFENDEMNDPERCALRELQEEAGLDESQISNLTLKYITTRKLPDEIRQQYVFFAETDCAGVKPHSDEGDIQWVDIDAIGGLKMSFTNEQCLKHYFAIGKYHSYTYSCSLSVADNAPYINFTCLQEMEFSY